MEIAMVVIGLTGTTGAGKGMVSAVFTAHGIPCLDTDAVSRTVTAKGMPCLSELTAAFGQGILTEDGSLDRKGLASLVFCEEDAEKKAEKLAALNRITHYHIRRTSETWLAAQREAGVRAAVIDAPLLFESGFDALCDKTVAVTAPPDVRLARIMARDNISRDLALHRMASQHDDAFFETHCDEVIANDGSLSELENAVRTVLRRMGLI